MPSAEKGAGAVRAVIFDWDGVLASTMEGNYRAWSEAFSPLGVVVPRREYFLREGMSALEVARYFLIASGLDPARAAEVRQSKEERFLAKNRLELYPAASRCIDRLREAGIALALVTGAGRKRLAESGALEFLAGFANVVSADDVKNGKPDPESYVKALAGLGRRPEECLVVENAPLGIRAAKGAGLPVLALTTTLPRESLAEADWILDGLEAFLDWMQLRGPAIAERNKP